MVLEVENAIVPLALRRKQLAINFLIRRKATDNNAIKNKLAQLQQTTQSYNTQDIWKNWKLMSAWSQHSKHYR
jgi:hypothetical protein